MRKATGALSSCAGDMELRRFFVPRENINGNMITVTGGEFEHMTRVLRIKKGFKVLVCADDGKERLCVVEEAENGVARLRQEEVREADRRKISLTLYCGLLKNSKLDLVVQKAVELGVERIVPFVSAYTAERRFNVDRAERIALEAAKQCGSVWLSRVEPAIAFREVVGRFSSHDSVFMAYEGERKRSLKNAVVSGRDIALVVGSEGGFRPEEVESAAANGAQIVTLGRRILRAETADIVGAALLLDAAGELDYD